ncbi:hypothetical protein NNX28_15350 [Arthrobacter sp. zg-Y859]|uniref:YkuD domain-containing protein n=1 Tax=Arthrobacter jinronghuae TaxID=2964609 RepID=A0ABT1NXR0_9MICC|nr:hypothetical protein [Arthrobacter jinronghuae]MCQ1951294.1 hypothetical protein [Arthrobacter jinronghuae]UWX78935.1 hypothetical protein N2K98_01560 [Arthrobacter jinronghuae]
MPALPAAGAEQEHDPCARLNAGEVRYSVREAKRVTFATAEKYGATETRLTGCVFEDGAYVQEWQSWGFSGRNGFAPPGSMWENTLYSPTGSFSFTEALGRSNPGTELEYHELKPSSRWGGKHGENYNQYFEGEGEGADENLWRYMEQGLYEQAAVINWNRQPDMPTRQGASFAIFFHAGYAPTWGCISTDLATVTRLLRGAVPGDRIVMGTVEDVFTASTAASEAAAAAAARAEEKAAAVEQRLETLTHVLMTLGVLAALGLLIRLAFKRAGRQRKPRRAPPSADSFAKTAASDRQAAARPRAHTGWSPPAEIPPAGASLPLDRPLDPSLDSSLDSPLDSPLDSERERKPREDVSSRKP